MVVDPTDDCTFFYTTEYIPANGAFNWSTRIGSFKFPGCGATTNDFSISASPNTVTVTSGASGNSTISTAVTSGSAQSVALSVSGLPAGATSTFNPTSVTAGGSSTLTLGSGTAAAGTYPLTVTGTGASATHTTNVTFTIPHNDFSLAASPNSVTLSQGTQGNATILTAVTSGNAETVTLAVSGLPSGATGTFNPTSVSAGNSSTLTINAGTAAAGTYTVTITGTTADATHGASLTLTFTSASSGGIINGGFETGNLFGWTLSGASVSVVSRRCHTGSFCARLGAPTRTNGDSNLAQTFTASPGVTRLSFFYEVVCTDTVRYDWATATLRDNTAGFTTTVLRKTCSNTGRYVNVATAVTPGHSYTLALTSHDDNYPGDPTYTLYADVTVQ